MSVDKIVGALRRLDPENADHWTDDGAPRVGVVAGLANMQLKRKDLSDALPGFSREAAKQDAEAVKTAKATAAETEGAAPQPEIVDPDELKHKLEMDYAVAKANLEEHDAEAEKAKEARKALVVDMDKKFAQLNEAFPPMSFAQGQLAHINSEIARRQKQAGLTTVPGGVASPIDASMARRNTRGHQRPQFAPAVG